METNEKELTGYPSIDKPWLKYYSEEAINAPLPEKTMYQYVYDNNKDHLSDIAFIYYGGKISYGDFFDNIHNTVKAFRAFGIVCGDIVTIMSMHTPETVCAIYALNYIGAIANLIYMTLSENEIVNAIKNTDSKMLMVLEPALDRINREKIDIPVVVLSVSQSMALPIKAAYTLKNKVSKHSFITFNDFIVKGKNTEIGKSSTDCKTTSVIVYTSGTTGEPKGVCLSSFNINSVVYQFQISGNVYGRQETFLDIIPPFFAYGVSMIQLAISSGLLTTLHINVDAENVAQEFMKVKPNHFASGPAFLDSIVSNMKGDMSSLINFTGGGGAISEDKEFELNKTLKEHGANVKYLIGYGMTELSAAVCACFNHIYKAQTVGVPLPKSCVKILNMENGEEQTYEQVGEVCFSGPSIMMGYYNNIDATNEIISVDSTGNKWLNTGDLGYVDKEGFLHITGKIKRIYITKGADDATYKLFPKQIENLFEENHYVESCAVIVKDNEIKLTVPIAFITLKENNTDRNNVIKALWKKAKLDLPSHMIPIDIIAIDNMPMTPSGKIDYRALEKMAEEMENKNE